MHWYGKFAREGRVGRVDVGLGSSGGEEEGYSYMISSVRGSVDEEAA